MEKADTILGSIKRKVAHLIEQNKRYKDEVVQLERERERFIKEKIEQEEKITFLEQRIKVLEAAKGITEISGGSKAARRRVSKILREIDSCIALMK